MIPKWKSFAVLFYFSLTYLTRPFYFYFPISSPISHSFILLHYSMRYFVQLIHFSYAFILYLHSHTHIYLYFYICIFIVAHECDFVDNKISCSCRKGYKVDDVDEKNCVDVDECLEHNGRYGVGSVT